AGGGSSSGITQVIARPRRLSRSLWAGALVLLLAALAVGLVLYTRRPAEGPRVLRASVLPPEKAPFVASSLPALSPDGRRVVFAAGSEGHVQLFVRDLDLLDTRALAGTD